MTIALRESGAWGSGTTSITPALPAGLAAGDIMLLFAGCKPFGTAISASAGWTELAAGGGTNGTTAPTTDLGSVAWKVFYREWQSGDAAPTVTLTTADTALAVVKAFSKTAASWATPVAAKGSDTTSGTAFSLAMDADPGITVNDMLAHFAVIAGNNSTFGTPTITATSATIGTVTEHPATEGTTVTGTDLEASASHALCTTGTGTAAPVCGWTLSVAQTGGGSIIRFREAAAAGSPPPKEPLVVSAKKRRKRTGKTTQLRATLEGNQPIRPPKRVAVQPRKRRRRAAVVHIQRAPRQQPVVMSRAPTRLVTLVTAKKRRRRFGSTELLRAKGSTPAPAVRPSNPATIVTRKKRKPRQGATHLLSARASILPATQRRAPITLVQPDKRRKRAGSGKLLRAKLLAAVVPAIRPKKPATIVTARKRRKRAGETTLVTGARRVQAAAPAVRPSKPIQTVDTRKRRQKPQPTQLLRPARGAPAAAAKKPSKPITQVKPPKRRKRSAETTLVTGARRAAPQRKRSPLIVAVKRKRRSKSTTKRISPRGGIVSPITRAIRIDHLTVSLSPSTSSPVALGPSQSGTIQLQPLATETHMSTLNSAIKSVVAGDDLDIVRTVTAIPATQTLTKAWLTFKTNPTAVDPGLLQKEITPSAVAGVGQITDTGASGTGSLLFQLTQANTLALPIGKNVPYDIKVLTSANKIYTAEQGNYFAVRRLTTATS